MSNLLALNISQNILVDFWLYRVPHKFRNALFCWLRVSWWKDWIFFGLKWTIHSLASKWHHNCFSSMSNTGVRCHLSQKINGQMAASENSKFKLGTKCCFCKLWQNFSLFLLNLIVYKEKSYFDTFCHWQKGSGINWFYYIIRHFFCIEQIFHYILG